MMGKCLVVWYLPDTPVMSGRQALGRNVSGLVVWCFQNYQTSCRKALCIKVWCLVVFHPYGESW